MTNYSIPTATHKLNDSSMWYHLIKVKQCTCRADALRLENGLHTRFLEDNWVDDEPLCIVILVFYELCNK